ncbi:hypothetical protein ACJ99F_004859 [Klebsiella pneumoniae]
MIKPIAVALILLTPSAYADVDLPAELKDKIEAVGINPVSAEKSPVSGIYSVFSKEGTSTSRLTVNTSSPEIYSK